MGSNLWKSLVGIRIDERFYPLAFVYAFPLRLCLTARRIQYEPLRAAHWTGRGWPLYHDALQTVLRIALPEKFTCLGSSVFFFFFYSCGSMSREAERVKMMSGGRRLVLIINHHVERSFASSYGVLNFAAPSTRSVQRVHAVGEPQK